MSWTDEVLPGVMVYIYIYTHIHPRKILGFPAIAAWNVLVTWPSLLASWLTQIFLGGGKPCDAWHLTHHLTVRNPKRARIVSGQVRSTVTAIEWACIPTLSSFQFYFCFHLFYFLYCWFSARSISWISCSCSSTTAGYTSKRSSLGQKRPLGQQHLPSGVIGNCSFILQLHNHHSWHPQGKRVNIGAERVTGQWWAQLELLLKLVSKWRPGTFQRIKYWCWPLMTDRTTKPKSRDCHWKHPCWRTVIGSL